MIFNLIGKNNGVIGGARGGLLDRRSWQDDYAYNTKRAMAYRARCRSYDVHDFLASYSLPFRKFRRTISKNDKKRRRA